MVLRDKFRKEAVLVSWSLKRILILIRLDLIKYYIIHVTYTRITLTDHFLSVLIIFMIMTLHIYRQLWWSSSGNFLLYGIFSCRFLLLQPDSRWGSWDCSWTPTTGERSQTKLELSKTNKYLLHFQTHFWEQEAFVYSYSTFVIIWQ